MTTLLVRIFIKDSKNIDSPAVRKQYGVLSGVCGIILNVLLSASKFVVGTLTNSVAIVADAINNLVDCLTSLLTILGFRWSAKPPDKEHPFGHARIEYLVSLVVAAFILLTGYEVMRSSISTILVPQAMYFTPWAVVVLVFGMIVKLWMFVFNRRLGRTVNSDALIAVGIDSRNDVIITAATLVALLVSLFSDLMIDGYVGALIALVFLRSGFGVAKDALGKIIGKPIEPHVAADIRRIVKGYGGVLGVHDLVVHNYGPGRNMASLHVEMPLDMTLAESHDIIERASNEVLEKLGIEMVAHIDPIDTGDERLQGAIERVRGLLQQHHPTLQAHEFRIISGIPKPKLVFDLEIPHKSVKAAAVLRNAITEDVSKALADFDCEINFEHGYEY